MTWSVAERKVPGGKLLRVKVECRDGIIAQVRIEGDFFVHPEEGVANLERTLIGAKLGDRDGILLRLQDVVDTNKLVLLGFSPKDLTDLLEVTLCSATNGA